MPSTRRKADRFKRPWAIHRFRDLTIVLKMRKEKKGC
jgi:hypothetical protein